MRILLAAAAASALASPAFAQAGHEMHDMPMPANPAPTTAPATPVAPTAGMDHEMGGMQGMQMASGALGAYPMTREASGTAWQPDTSQHQGLHIMSGPWTVMLHATLNGVYDWQQGRRGDDKAFVSGMLMAIARRDIGPHDTLQLKAMLSPDPFMGKSGFPELLATGETANGVTPLTDRQHPHDLFMELSASLAHRITEKDSVFLYAGLPGEPAFGPPAFMHRLSIMDSPEAPISHHWLDSTHITFGVVTAGYVHGDWKLEASRFRGREPDEHRFDIEHAKLDSTAVRLSWNPTRNWSLQASWADQKSPEQLEPEQNIRRLSASAIYTVPFGEAGYWSTTAAWGRRTSDEGDLDAYALESAVKLDAAWTVFGRAERIETNELTPGPGAHGPVFTVGKLSVGAVRDVAISRHWSFGLGGLYAVNFVPGVLRDAYGRRDPQGAMGFVRLKLH